MTELGEVVKDAAIGATCVATLVVISPIVKALANRIRGTRVSEGATRMFAERTGMAHLRNGGRP